MKQVIALVSAALLAGCAHTPVQGEGELKFAYAVPAVGSWDPQRPPVLRLAVNHVGTTPAGMASFDMRVANTGGAACIAKNIVTSRGLAWLVVDEAGRRQEPARPAPISPAMGGKRKGSFRVSEGGKQTFVLA